MTLVISNLVYQLNTQKIKSTNKIFCYVTKLGKFHIILDDKEFSNDFDECKEIGVRTH